MASKSKRMTLAGHWLKQREQELKEEHAVDAAMPPDVRKVIEEKLGRSLTHKETLQDGLDGRRDSRSMLEAMEQGNWKPKMPAVEGDATYDDAIREAEEAVRQEKLAKLSEKERMLYFLKQGRQEKMDREAAENAYQERLADPKIAAKIAELEDLSRETAYDPDWEVGEIDAIERALVQIRTPGSDTDEFFNLAKDAFAIRAAKRQAVLDKVLEHRSELENQIAALQAELGQSDEDAEDDVEDALEVTKVEVTTFGTKQEAWEALQAAKAAGEDQGVINAHLTAWSDMALAERFPAQQAEGGE